MGKNIEEYLPRIDLRILKRMGHLHPGATGEIEDIWYGVGSDAVTLRFWDGARGVGQTVKTEKMDCHLGGHRISFVCPVCGTRRMVLYVGKDDFRCRTCADVRYLTQCEHKPGRLLLKAEKIRQKLDARPDDLDCKHIARPKHMRQTTFTRLKLEARRYYRQGQKLLAR